MRNKLQLWGRDFKEGTGHRTNPRLRNRSWATAEMPGGPVELVLEARQDLYRRRSLRSGAVSGEATCYIYCEDFDRWLEFFQASTALDWAWGFTDNFQLGRLYVEYWTGWDRVRQQPFAELHMHVVEPGGAYGRDRAVVRTVEEFRLTTWEGFASHALFDLCKSVFVHREHSIIHLLLEFQERGRNGNGYVVGGLARAIEAARQPHLEIGESFSTVRAYRNAPLVRQEVAGAGY
jgi:hypothetical protein